MDFLNEEDYQNLAAGALKGAPGAGAFGLATNAPIRTAQKGRMNSLQQLALARIGQGGQRRKMMEEVESQMAEEQRKQQEPGLFDFLNIGAGAANVMRGFAGRNRMKNFKQAHNSPVGPYPDASYLD